MRKVNNLIINASEFMSIRNFMPPRLSPPDIVLEPSAGRHQPVIGQKPIDGAGVLVGDVTNVLFSRFAGFGVESVYRHTVSLRLEGCDYQLVGYDMEIGCREGLHNIDPSR